MGYGRSGLVTVGMAGGHNQGRAGHGAGNDAHGQAEDHQFLGHHLGGRGLGGDGAVTMPPGGGA